MAIKKLFEKIKNYFFHDNNEPDWYIISTILFLTAFGLIMLCSAGVAVGWQKFHDPYYYFKHQLLVGVIPGLILMFFFSKFDYHRLRKFAPGLLLFSIALLVLVLIPGIGGNWGTSRSWISIFGFSIQPSEIVKLTFLLYLASWLSSKEESHLKDFQYGFAPFLFVLGVISFLTLMEPDTGTMMIIILMSLSVYFTAGGKVIHLTWLGVLGAGALGLLIKFSPYRGERFTTFLHPELDPLGAGYHINQALLAVGSGGWLGKGYGHSIQKFNYLPEVISDSIFAVVSEELGFIFASIIVAVFVFLAIRSLKLAQICEDNFGKFIVVGIISWFMFQAFFNIGAMIGILPITGVTLPFISSGGTSIMVSLAAAGILVNISKQNSYR